MAAALERRAAPHPRFDPTVSRGRVTVLADGSVQMSCMVTIAPATAVPDLVQVALFRDNPPIELRTRASVSQAGFRRDGVRVEAFFTAGRVRWMGDPMTLDIGVLVGIGRSMVRRGVPDVSRVRVKWWRPSSRARA